jgi:hypothetical protein
MTTSDAVTISSLATPSEALAFRVINEGWISTLFALTDEDRRVLNNPLTQIFAPGGDVLARSLSPGTRLVTADGRHPGDHLGKPHHSGPSLRQSAPHDGASRRKRPRRRNCNLKMDGYRTTSPINESLCAEQPPMAMCVSGHDGEKPEKRAEQGGQARSLTGGSGSKAQAAGSKIGSATLCC